MIHAMVTVNGDIPISSREELRERIKRTINVNTKNSNDCEDIAPDEVTFNFIQKKQSGFCRIQLWSLSKNIRF